MGTSPEELKKAISAILSIANKDETTARMVRRKAEEKLSLPPNTLDEASQKATIDTMIREWIAAQSEKTEESEEEEEAPVAKKRKAKQGAKDEGEDEKKTPKQKKKEKKSVSDEEEEEEEPKKKKAKKSKKSKDSDSEEEPKKKKSKSKKKSKGSDEEESEEEEETKKKKTKKSKKDDSDDDTKKISPRGRRTKKELTENEQKIKELKDLIHLTGLRIIGLKGLNEEETIAHLKKILSDNGLTGKVTKEKAKKFGEKRALQQEVDSLKIRSSFITNLPRSARSTRSRGTSYKVDAAFSQVDKALKEEYGDDADPSESENEDEEDEKKKPDNDYEDPNDED